MSPIPGTVVAVRSTGGDEVARDQPLVVVESMKMEHAIRSPVAGVVEAIAVQVGETVERDQTVAVVRQAIAGEADPTGAAEDHLVHTPSLDEARDRHARLEDHRRPEAVERRRAQGRRTARENLADLIDPGSFTEFGALAIAAQSGRRSHEDLIDRTSTDGVITGVGTIGSATFDRCEAAVIVYDATVLAGTQGYRGHQKQDRILETAHRRRLPVVVFAEGGGGRPGDVDVPIITGLDVRTFRMMAAMRRVAPSVAVVAGYCFAGNAVLAAGADAIIATADSNLGAGGPAMIEGGGLGVFDPTEIGPIDDQVRSGVVDMRAADEAHATSLARRYLGYFQGSVPGWSSVDQTELETIVPEDRKQLYDTWRVIEVVCDSGSVLELRPQWGPGMVTALGRVEGHPVGILANVPANLGGAIDARVADKAARFLDLCGTYDLPVVVLCDTPGFMVGPESERQGLLRAAGDMLKAAARVTTLGTVVLRKGYGLGAQAMAGGAFQSGAFTVSWPTGEFGAMNLEGAVRLGYRKELQAIDDLEERQLLYERLVAKSYERGKALMMAGTFEIDAVIDPADTRRWISAMARSAPVPRWRAG
jgi:acetyl-CoA carboxylase carboxyltransferase component